MKKLILVSVLLICAMFAFASNWKAIEQVDSFGDLSGKYVITTDLKKVAFGREWYEYQEISVIIGKSTTEDNVYSLMFYFPNSWYMGNATEPWVVSVKDSSGRVYNLTGNVRYNYVTTSQSDRLIGMFRDGCKIVLQSSTKNKDVFNLGDFFITQEDLNNVK